MDRLLLKSGRKLGVECKRVDAPRLSSSMRIALQDLELDCLAVIYPGDRQYSLADGVTAAPLDAAARGEAAALFE